jgi:GT2 family glycosyltransferase
MVRASRLAYCQLLIFGACMQSVFESPDVSMVGVSYNTLDLLPRMLESFNLACTRVSAEILFVDNASADGSAGWLREQKTIKKLIINEENVGFGRANNQLLPFVNGRYVLLLNTDAFVAHDALEKTVAWMDANPRCGVLGVRLVGDDRSLQPSCRYFPTPINLFLHRTGFARFFPHIQPVDPLDLDHEEVRECDWVPGCFYLVRKEVVDEVGLFDPRFFMYFEEVDHCRRVKAAGWQVVFYPCTEVVHLGGESAKTSGELTRGKQLSPLQVESEVLYIRKHHGRLGVIGHLFLLMITDLIVLIKSAAKRILTKRHSKEPLRFLHTLRAFTLTKFASRPTR